MDRARFEHWLTRRANRRRVLLGGGAVAVVAASFAGRPTRGLGGQATPGATPLASPFASAQASPIATPAFGASPFGLGVASGDPLPDGVVLWTRLAPDPLNGGGMDGQGPVEVRWELAADDGFGQVVQTGVATATPDLSHSVHVDVRGLEPGAEYFYRFQAGGEVSPIGRTKTTPALGTALDRLRFAFASCQHYEDGFYAAYRHMAADDLDLVVHLGDYIYEGGAAAGFADAEDPAPTPPRLHTGAELLTLEDYRNRHALYKTDPDLQAAHAAFPWAVTWDDHEVDNNYAAAAAEDGVPADQFLLRRANAYQAYYEHLPLRPASMPVGPDLRLYRRLTYGDLAEFSVLDTRQYRSDHPCGDDEQVRCPAALDPATTMTGPDQERWLLAGLDASSARWNVLAQQVMMAQLDLQPGPGAKFAGDLWDGYAGARNRILSHLMSRGVSNPVVITGDIHSSWVNDLKADFADPDSPTVATEFVGTSISSGGDPTEDALAETEELAQELLPENPHVRFFDGRRRGYVRCELTPDTWRTDIQGLDSVATADAPIATIASFVVENGRPGANPA